MQDYKQISQDGQAEIVIKGSRFICHLKRVNTEDEAKNFIADIKKIHKKATHNCSAYLIGETDLIQRAHDDGEPSGTAGVPMLEVLKKNELHFIVAVVTRYFGGTKLGAGGLIRAYSSAVSNALNEVGIIMHTKRMQVLVSVPYALNGKLEYFLNQSIHTILDVSYTDNVTYTCGVLSYNLDNFKQEITELLHGKAIIEETVEEYIDLPLEKISIDLSEEHYH